ncbi:MAG: anti-sigma factor RsbA family regulatory protein [Egibacteraceae bacterium]
MTSCISAVKTARHQALLFASREQFLDGVVPFMREGVELGEAVLAVVQAARLPTVLEALGPAVDAVRLAESEVWHARPAVGFARLCDFVRDAAKSGARVLIEPPFGERPEQVAELGMLEVGTHLVLGAPPARVICAYDTRSWPPPVARLVRRTHPEIIEDGARCDSLAFTPATTLLAEQRAGPPLPEPAGPVAELRFPFEARQLRRFVHEQADAAGLSPDRVEDLVVAVQEVTLNALVYASFAEVRWWRQDSRVVCEVGDHGVGMDGQLAGCLPPWHPASAGGGLWLARQLVDLLELRSGADGTVVRLHMNSGRL